MERIYTIERAKCVTCGNIGVVYIHKKVYCSSCYKKERKELYKK